jgi:hypothetical protein
MAGYVRQHFDRSRERADQLIRIANGDTTLEKERERRRQSMAKVRAKRSVPRGTDFDIDDGDLTLGPQKSLVYECIKEHGPITDEGLQDRDDADENEWVFSDNRQVGASS